MTATILIIFTAVVLGQKFSLPLILDWRSIRGDTTIGWTIGFAWLLAGFITCVFFFNIICFYKANSRIE